MTDIEEIKNEMREMGYPHVEKRSEEELRVSKAYGNLILTLDDIIRDLEERVSELTEQANEFEAAVRKRCEE